MSGCVPKSLHTVTVLVRLARMSRELSNHDDHTALVWAFNFLGYGQTPDEHNLFAAALKVLPK